MVDLLETYVENRWIIQPNNANTHGTAHGGSIMKWMDEVGAMAAMRFAGKTCVTARMDQVNFERPVPVGSIALISAYVYDAGKTSVKVRLEAEREDPLSGERERTTESFFVYVALDDDDRPTAVPDVTTSSDRGEKLRERALEAEEAMGDEREQRS